MALSDDKLWDLWNTQGTDDMSKAEAFVFARAIESEVRKQDTELIRQLVEALCECAEDSQEQLDRMEAARLRDYKPNAIAWQEDTIAKAKAAIVAGRARLEIESLKAQLHTAPTTQPAPQQEARPVTPYTCPKCSALWLHWPAEQSGFGRDTLNCRSTTHCDYCEKGGVEQLQRLERVPAVLAAPQPAPEPDVLTAGGDSFLLLPTRPTPDAPANTAGLSWDAYSGAQMLAYGRLCSDAALLVAREGGVA